MAAPASAIVGRRRLHAAAGHGVWRSLVARFVRDEEAAGSNPVTPTLVEVLVRRRSWPGLPSSPDPPDLHDVRKWTRAVGGASVTTAPGGVEQVCVPSERPAQLSLADHLGYVLRLVVPQYDRPDQTGPTQPAQPRSARRSSKVSGTVLRDRVLISATCCLACLGSMSHLVFHS